MPAADRPATDFAGIYADGGIRIGQLARDLYRTRFDQTYDLAVYNLAMALKFTPQLMRQLTHQVLFEAAFQFRNYRTRVDILVRNQDQTGWKLIEVKAKSNRVFSGRGGRAGRLELLADLMYQFYILNQCHVQLTEVSLLLLRHDYTLTTLEVNVEQLFTQLSAFIAHHESIRFIDYCRQHEAKTAALLEALTTQLVRTSQWPVDKILLTDRCFNEETRWRRFFGHCPHVLPYGQTTGSVFDLSRPGVRAVILHYHYQIKLMIDIPSNFQFHPRFKINGFTHNQTRQITVAHDPTAVICQSKTHLIQHAWKAYRAPLYFYDFESFQSPSPVYRHTHPYQQVVFQYSVHIMPHLNCVDADVHHCEYIALSAEDFRLTLITRLINDFFKLGRGVYVAYNKSFECGRLKEFIAYLQLLIADAEVAANTKSLYQQYIIQLQFVIDHTIDLMIFFSRFYVYLPTFRGRYSIKVTLPALAPQFSYRHLKIQQGDQASELFYRLVTGNITSVIWKKYLVPALLTYCAQDSWAMIVIWRKLQTMFLHQGIIS